MPYDREHGLLVWGGSLPGGEKWSNSLRMAETEETVFANDTAGWNVQEYLDHYTTVLNAHHTNSESKVSERCKLSFVKFNRVDVNGHYIDPTTFMNVFADVNGGGGIGNMHPNQIALTVSFTSAVSRGPASKGRLYSPMPAIVIETDGRISQGNALALATRWKATIEALSDVPGVDSANSPGACLMSKVGTGVKTRRISGVKVGRVLDTQRRRRRSLQESYEIDDVDQGVF